MADRNKIVPENVSGEFFVDSTCIDCDACRQLAPESFADAGEYSYVYAQPQSALARRTATRALLTCPTGSIGCNSPNLTAEVIADFPLHLEDNVFFCGFNSPKSYGGSSYFVEENRGNWLIDCPKFNNHLVRQFESKGGLAYIFLTHEDDVADADKYAAQFNAKRIIHEAALPACPDAEIVIAGSKESTFMANDRFVLIPTPGHTRGHMVALYDEKYLFTGDHLHFSRSQARLGAFKSHCWYSWEKQIDSMKKLKNFRFEWILPGHGTRVKLSLEQIEAQLDQLIAEMQS